MEKSADDLVMIVAAGGGVCVDADHYSVDQLASIAAAGSKHKPLIVMEYAGSRSTDDLVMIAAAGKGAVHFRDL